MPILVLIPTRPNMPAELSYRSYEAERCMKEACNHIDVVRDFRDAGVPEAVRGAGGLASQQERQAGLAKLRNELVAQYLAPQHSHVLWIDADIVVYDPLLPGKLVQKCSDGIIAPKVLTQGIKDRWHDLAGFVRDGKWAAEFPPYWEGIDAVTQPPAVVNMESVGACYMVPADVYRHGAQHSATEGFTEHASVCRAAREGLNMHVWLWTELAVFHVNDTGFHLNDTGKP